MRTMSMLLVSMLMICNCGGGGGNGSNGSNGGNGDGAGDGDGGGGNGSGGGGGFTVAITSPADGATVSGTVTIGVSASDSTNGVAYVELSFDGGAYFGKDMFSPYEFPWDTTANKEIQYVIVARATDKAGNIKLSDPVTVTVHNTTLVAPNNISWRSVVHDACPLVQNRDLVITWTDATIGKGSWGVRVMEANTGSGGIYSDSGVYNGGATPTTQTSTFTCMCNYNSTWITYKFQICQYIDVNRSISACSDWQGPISLL